MTTVSPAPVEWPCAGDTAGQATNAPDRLRNVPDPVPLAFDPEREEAELRAYLGDGYDRARLERHRHVLADEFADLEGDVPGGFDAAYPFDVIEHVPDAFAFLAELERRAALVEVNLLEFEPNEQELHYEIPIPDVLRHAARAGLESYRVYHGSSHL